MFKLKMIKLFFRKLFIWCHWMKVGNLVKNIEADYAVETVRNLAQEIPEIWINAKLDNDDGMINQNRNDVDSILMETAIGA